LADRPAARHSLSRPDLSGTIVARIVLAAPEGVKFARAAH
jgi:hypothetical protein